MVQISLLNSGGKVVFLRGVPWNPPLGTNGSKSTLLTRYCLVRHSPSFAIPQLSPVCMYVCMYVGMYGYAFRRALRY